MQAVACSRIGGLGAGALLESHLNKLSRERRSNGDTGRQEKEVMVDAAWSIFFISPTHSYRCMPEVDIAGVPLILKMEHSDMA